jgi:transcription elongation factor GreA
MHDELTKVDIKKMQEEVDYRMCVLRPQLLAEVQRTREYGDLSENAEYKEAKREKNANESRIRYLKKMIETARVIKVETKADAVCLFDTVTYYVEEDDEEEERQIVTTLRQDVLRGYLSKESPLGKALLGKKIGGEHEALHPQIQGIHKTHHPADDGNPGNLPVPDHSVIEPRLHGDPSVRSPHSHRIAPAVAHHDAFHDRLTAYI